MPHLNFYLKKFNWIYHKNICTSKFIATQFNKAKFYDQLGCPMIKELEKNMWCVHNMKILYPWRINICNFCKIDVTGDNHINCNNQSQANYSFLSFLVSRLYEITSNRVFINEIEEDLFRRTKNKWKGKKGSLERSEYAIYSIQYDANYICMTL